jgi:two-component system response regulator YesN
VEKNYPQEIPLSQVAAFLHLSENYAGVYFKNATGLHFSEYLNRTRLFHAMKMLRETGCTIKEIAYAVGFHSPEYLARLFTASFGVSPREYRRSFDRL